MRGHALLSTDKGLVVFRFLTGALSCAAEVYDDEVVGSSLFGRGRCGRRSAFRGVAKKFPRRCKPLARSLLS